MALILNIDTATEHASGCLSKHGEFLAIENHPKQTDHAAFIQPAIKKLMLIAGYPLSDIDAVAVSNGPGSYTGLRVGLSTAKGICYALDKPLILINTLEIIASAAIGYSTGNDDKAMFFCPMIDARRMEVFTAVYDYNLQQTVTPTALILTEQSFSNLLDQHTIMFSGSGSEKFRTLIKNDNTIFLNMQHDARHMQTIAENMYLLKTFADKAYSEPYYLKKFYKQAPKLQSE